MFEKKIQYDKCFGFSIRIASIECDSQQEFTNEMDKIARRAKKDGFKCIFYADTLSDQLLHLFKVYGFEEKPGDPYNRYLYLHL